MPRCRAEAGVEVTAGVSICSRCRVGRLRPGFKCLACSSHCTIGIPPAAHGNDGAGILCGRGNGQNAGQDDRAAPGPIDVEIPHFDHLHHRESEAACRRSGLIQRCSFSRNLSCRKLNAVPQIRSATGSGPSPDPTAELRAGTVLKKLQRPRVEWRGRRGSNPRPPA